MIRHDFSAASLIAANEENLASWLLVFSKLEGACLNDVDGVRRSITNIRMSLFNSIMDSRLATEQVDATIQYLQADAEKRQVPILWWVGPSSRPADLADRLVKRGFTIDEDGPGMAVELEKLNESLPRPEGLAIKPAQDDDGWQAWCRALAAGFQIPSERVEFVESSWCHLFSIADPAVTQAYTAWLDGVPVATSLLQLGGGVAGIYAVATAPEARRQGIGAQVTLYPLLQARALGYRIGILQASEMGLPVYRSLGFRECCRITSYSWAAGKPKSIEG
ncbi:MAG: GNAT family N-acetyltransferase [Anaerolineae bacterium]|nr:GNAT family N-acetyltransferase [Anaerolineae bacterium]